MKLYLRGLLIAIFMYGLVSCSSQKPISKIRPDNNRSYDVEYLFEHDGCKVYRFRDMGHYIYFTNCTGDVTSIVNDSLQNRVAGRINGF